MLSHQGRTPDAGTLRRAKWNDQLVRARLRSARADLQGQHDEPVQSVRHNPSSLTPPSSGADPFQPVLPGAAPNSRTAPATTARVGCRRFPLQDAGRRVSVFVHHLFHFVKNIRRTKTTQGTTNKPAQRSPLPLVGRVRVGPGGAISLGAGCVAPLLPTLTLPTRGRGRRICPQGRTPTGVIAERAPVIQAHTAQRERPSNSAIAPAMPKQAYTNNHTGWGLVPNASQTISAGRIFAGNILFGWLKGVFRRMIGVI